MSAEEVMVGGCTKAVYDALVTAFGGSDAQATVLCENFILTGTKPDDSSLRYGVNTMWLIICGALVFIMHGGFAMLCAGSIRSKNTMNILLQTILDACVSGIMFYLVGFGFAYGEGPEPNMFIGNAMFGLSRYKSHYTGVDVGRWTDFFYQWAFAATATTIPAGCVAERFNFNAYLGYTIFLSGFVYPVVVHWVWSRQGWLTFAANLSDPPVGRDPGNFLFKSGMIDFAGSAVVHMVGGLSGLMGCIMVGPRMGRFDSEGKPVDMPGHSAVLVVLGTVLLWFGWYGFNPGSTFIIDNETSATVAARAAVCTTLAGCAGGMTMLGIAFLRHKAWDMIYTCNGVLVGFVAITAGAHVLEPWAAIIDAFVAALVFEGVCILFLKLRIDDPLLAAPMHGFCGMWGIIFVGLMAKEEYVMEAYGRAPYYGAFYKGGGGRLLACQIVGILVIAAWVCTLMGIFFAIFKALGKLRIPKEEEARGIDASKHGGSVYNHYDEMAAGTKELRLGNKVAAGTGVPVGEGSSHGQSRNNSRGRNTVAPVVDETQVVEL